MEQGVVGGSGGAAGTGVEGYIPRILRNWQDLASDNPIAQREAVTPVKPETQIKQAEPVINQSFVVDRRRLEEEIISRELQRVREEFLLEARKIEDQRSVLIANRLKERYEGELRIKETELDRARRIINIQNAILTKVWEQDRETLLNVLEGADITEDDLAVLNGDEGQ